MRTPPAFGHAIVVAVCISVLTACGSQAAPVDSGRGDDGSPEPQATAAAGVRLVKIGDFQAPTAIASPPRDRRRVYVVEQGGVIRAVIAGRRATRPFLDISSRVLSGGEQGLLGLAFAPDHAESGRFYVYYTARDGRQVLEEYRRRSGEVADSSTRRRLFAHADPESNHNGGQIEFGPDGLLYIGTGDGGGAGDEHGTRGNGQDLGSPLGKILRIDPRAKGGRPYSIPPGNPFVSRSGARPEIYSYGLRNPWRFSFDRSSGAITIADVGQNAVEEINHLPKGAALGVNFGWRVFEGDRRFTDESAPGAHRPQLVLRHSAGYCSVTGGYVVRDPGLKALAGRYIFGDFCKPGVRSVRLSASGSSGLAVVPGAASVSSTSSFGQDAAGRLYVASLDGPVYRIAAR